MARKSILARSLEVLLEGGPLAFLRAVKRRVGGGAAVRPRVAQILGNSDALRNLGKVQIGEHSYGTVRVSHARPDRASLRIGKYCSVGNDVTFFLGGNHRPDWVTTYPFPAFDHWPEVSNRSDHQVHKGDIEVGNDVWIGAGATILSGVRVGNGAVVGAGAVVPKDIPPYAIAVGNPAKVVKYRFAPETIEALQQIAWWDWPEERLREMLPLMMSSDIDLFIAEARGRAAASSDGSQQARALLKTSAAG